LLEQFARHVLRSADTGRAKVDLAGIVLGVASQLLHGLGRHLGIDDDDVLQLGRHRQELEVVERVERNL
jgi:hypothetical protein